METKVEKSEVAGNGQQDVVSRSAYRIFRTKQEEYWDIWREDAIVFPKDKALEEVFTEDNLRVLIKSYEDKKRYHTYKITIHSEHGAWVEVEILSTDEDEKIYFEFVEMAAVIVVQ